MIKPLKHFWILITLAGLVACNGYMNLDNTTSNGTQDVPNPRETGLRENDLFVKYHSEKLSWQESSVFDPVRKMTMSRVYMGEQFDASKFMEQIQSAVGKTNKLKIRPGIYTWGKSSVKPALTLSGIKGLEIDASGAVLMGYRPTRAIQIVNCSKLSLKGLVVDYIPEALPFTQGTLIELRGNDGVVEIHRGYKFPDVNKVVRKVAVYHSDSLLLKEYLPTQYDAKVQSLEGRKFLVKNLVRGSEIGDYISFVQGQDIAHGVAINNCENLLVEDLTLHSAPMFALLDVGSRESIYRRVRLTPGPMPDGAEVPRLKSGAQDGIHLKDMKGEKGAIIEQCLIDSHSDDAIAINTAYSMLVDQDDEWIYIAVKNGKCNLSKGDEVRFTDHSNMEVKGRGLVEAIEKLNDSTKSKLLQDKKMSFNLSPFLSESALRRPVFYRLKMTNRSLLQTQNLLSLGSGNKGAIIRDNVIKNHRARALMLKTSDCLIEGNKIFHAQMSGVSFSVEKYWMEGDYGSNIIVRDNVFLDCGFNYRSPTKATAGLINFVGMGDKNQYAPVGQYKNILIENNYILKAHKIPFVFTSSKGVRVIENKVENSHFNHAQDGVKVGVDQSQMFSFINCEDLEIKSNKLVDTGIYFKQKDFASK